MGHKKKLAKKKVFIIAGVVVSLLLAVGAGALVWWLQHKDDVKNNNPPSVNIGVPTNVSEAQKLAMTGDIAGSEKKLQEAIDNPATPSDEKYELYVQQGVNLSNQKKYQQALDKLKEAEAIKQTFTVSHLIAEQAEALGNKALAIEYYKKTLTQLDPNAIGYRSDKRVFEAKVKELGGSL